MRDWISKLDDFLRTSEMDILKHAGQISHEEALDKAHEEYEKFQKILINKPSPVERHFNEVVEGIKRLEKTHRPRTTRKSK
jgi:hypothetical protein